MLIDDVVRQHPDAPRAGGFLTGGPTVADTIAAVFAADRLGVPAIVADPPAAGPPPVPPPGDVHRTPGVADPAYPAAGRVPADTWLVVATSGTAGRPRRVLRTARSWTSSLEAFTALTGLTAADRVLLTGPLHSTLHLFAAVHALTLGAELTDDPARATAAHAVPAGLAALLDRLPAGAPLRTAVVAGAALPAALGRRATARGVAVVEYYGAAELSFVAAARHPDELRPFPGVELQLRDGEIWVRSPYLALGYPPGTAGPLRRDGRGFATVGDLGAWTPTGGLTVRGRGDAALTVGGATVLAEDVEAVLTELPGVRAAAAVGVASTRLGQVLVAVLELTDELTVPAGPPSGPPTPALGRAIRRAARARLAAEALPRRWLVADRLPRTPGGKVARGAVAAAVTRHLGVPTDPLASADADPSSGPAPRLRPLP